MKLNEYKNSVGSLRLSEEFKQELKQKMLSQAQNQLHERDNKPEIKMTVGEFSKKYSKYAAIAACLLMAVSTVGVLSASKNAINSKIINSDKSTAEGAEDTAVEDIIESGDSVYDVDEYDAPTESSESDDGIKATMLEPDYDDAFENESDETPMAPEADDVVPEAAPCTSANGYSPYASEKYDGRYYGEDYVLNNTSRSAKYTANVVEELNVSAKVVKADDVFGGGSSGNGIDEAEAEPTDGGYADEEESEEINTAMYSMSFEGLTEGSSREYYDIRDEVIASLSNVALIRFSTVDSYETADEVASNSAGLRMDTNAQTLYRVNVTYDYFNGEETDTERLLLNTGNSSNQLIGRPSMEGEYIAVVTENEDGVLEPIPQLIYAVHTVRGLDIAYHLYSDDGFMVDPGYTNMGLMPEERTLISSTSNNPEIYTQKAAVRELTYYLKRNILRMEPNVLDFSDETENEEPDDSAQTPEQEEAPRETIRALFPTGKLKLTLGDELLEIAEYTSENSGEIKVNGIGIGAEMADALEKFFLSKYSFTPDAKITLCASEEDGGWFAVVTFSENAVTKIEVFE